MSRIIKAEWFRLTHFGIWIRWTILVLLFGILYSVIGGEPAIFDKTLAEALHCMNEGMMSGVFLIFPIYVGVLTASAYSNKTVYYQVMSGNKITSVIFSKVIVYAGFMTGMTWLLYGILWLGIGWKNGVGEVGQLPLRMFLFGVIILHSYAVAVLIVTAFRRLAAVVVVFLWFGAVHLGISIAINYLLAASEMRKIKMLSWILPNQLYMAGDPVFGTDVAEWLVFPVIASMIIEVAFWYLLSYFGMKRRWYH